MYLPSIKHIFLNGNVINETSILSSLHRLEILRLSNNGLRELPYLCPGLLYLDLSSNEIEDISKISYLEDLLTLDLSINLIKNIFPLSNLKSLEHLYLNNNKIHDISYLRLLPDLKLISLDINPIKDCPFEVWGGNDVKLIRGYFDSLQRQYDNENIDRQEVKLVFVGNSAVGKTQLINLLITGKYSNERNTTHGINVIKLYPSKSPLKQLKNKFNNNFSINIWDFGGQEYYHGTHQLFLSNHAVYVLLWDKSTNLNGVVNTELSDGIFEDLEHFDYCYWLESIRYYAPDSPILIVQNKIDDPYQSKERISNELLELFKVEQDECSLSLMNALSDDSPYKRLFDNFCDELRDLLISSASKFKYNSVWLSIRDEIVGLANNKDNKFSNYLNEDAWIDFGDFNKVCIGIDSNFSDDELHGLVNWLNNIGTLNYYPNNPRLKSKIFLSPKWITTKIYEILDKTVLSKKGEFSLSDIHDEPNKTEIFIELMKEMDIIFPHPLDKDVYIAPQYLPSEHAIEDLFAIAELGLRRSSYRIRVPIFFYKKLMHRLILYFGMEADVVAKYYWKHGIVFVTKGGTRCLVKGLYTEESNRQGVILIGIENSNEHDRLQKEIFERLLIILSRKEEELGFRIYPPTLGIKSILENNTDIKSNEQEEDQKPLKALWRLDVKNAPRWLQVLEIAVSDSTFISLLKLIKHVKIGKKKIELDSGEVLLINKFRFLLDQNVSMPLKVFLSYSHNDTQLMRRLDTHLAPLKRLEKVVSWTDREIIPGSNWDLTIQNQLNEADIVLLLISADFIASDYIWNKEFANALEREERRQCIVVPILLQPVDYNGLPFSEKQMIPIDEGTGKRELRPIALWSNTEQGFAEVAKQIRVLIDKKELYFT